MSDKTLSVFLLSAVSLLANEFRTAVLSAVRCWMLPTERWVVANSDGIIAESVDGFIALACGWLRRKSA